MDGGNLSDKAGLEKKDIINKKDKVCPVYCTGCSRRTASCYTQANLTWPSSVISRLLKAKRALGLLKPCT